MDHLTFQVCFLLVIVVLLIPCPRAGFLGLAIITSLVMAAEATVVVVTAIVEVVMARTVVVKAAAITEAHAEITVNQAIIEVIKIVAVAAIVECL